MSMFIGRQDLEAQRTMSSRWFSYKNFSGDLLHYVQSRNPAGPLNNAAMQRHAGSHEADLLYFQISTSPQPRMTVVDMKRSESCRDNDETLKTILLDVREATTHCSSDGDSCCGQNLDADVTVIYQMTCLARKFRNLLDGCPQRSISFSHVASE